MAFPVFKEARLKEVVAANAPAMLFGAAREIIRAATGRGPFPPVIIPSTHFLEPKPPGEKALKKKSAKKTGKKKTAKKAGQKKAARKAKK